MPAAPRQRRARKGSPQRTQSPLNKKRPQVKARVTGATGEVAQARRQVETQLAALQTIQRVAQSLNSEVGLEPLLHKVLHGAIALTQASAGSLLLHDPNTDQLRFAVSEGGGQQALEGREMPSQRGIAGWVFTHGEPLIINDAGRDERFDNTIDKSLGFETVNLVGVPLMISGKKIGVLEVLNKHSGGPFTRGDLEVLNVLAAQSSIAIENARLYQHLWSERNRTLAVEEDVRRELARDMHDGPAQLVSALVMNVRFVQALLDEGTLDMAKQELTSMEDLATRALKQMRELLFNQRPLVLETQGLIPAIETYIERLKATQGLDIAVQVDSGPVRLPGKADRTVFSIVMEAVGNARKHAPGARVRVNVTQRPDHLLIEVADEGPGFDMARVRSTYDQRGSLGLLNMSERAQQIGSVLKIVSTPGTGTSVTLDVPLDARLRTLAQLPV
jgi:signal transduction histidine kinase